MVPEDDGVDDKTAMLTRRARRKAAVAAEGAVPATDDVEDDATASADDATIVVSRAVNDTEVDDATVVVERSTSAQAAGVDPEDDVLATIAPAPRTGPLTPQPALYKPRPAPLRPGVAPVVTGATAPTRTTDPERLSVVKQARRQGAFTIIALVAASLVSVGGLVALGYFVFI